MPDDDAPISRRAPSLEIVRYLMLVGLAAATAATAWLVSRSGSSAVVDGDIAMSDVDRIDIARVVAISAVSAALLLVTVWSTVAARWFRRSGHSSGEAVVPTTLATLVAALATGVGPVLDTDRGTPSFVAIVVGVAAAFVAVSAIGRVAAEQAQTTTSLALWSFSLLLVPVTLWAARLDRPTMPTDSLQAITFFAAVQAIALALAVVFAAVATGTIEERVRLHRAE